MFERSKIARIVAEFLGTAILTAVVLTVSKSNLGVPYFIGLAGAMALAAGTMVFGAISGAHFNPAITLGLWSARQIKVLTAVVYIAAQLLGATVAYLLYTYFVSGSWMNTGHYDARVLVAEAVGAFVFSLGWAASVFS
ncbi:MAG TPA: aquaporin, partial [Candidatus Pristimantibacillus sp.]|nr:aquaporin [Candidatus Pristimantibacillus sp.]